MNVADILILLTLLLPAVVGAAYGFLNIVFSITAWVLSVGIALKFGAQFAPLLESYVESPLIRGALSFVGVFLLSLLILSALGYFILKLLGRSGLTAADRFLGLCFGICLGGAIIGVVVFLAGFTALPREKMWQESKLLPPFVEIAVWTEQFLPQNVVEYHGYKSEVEGG
ncbi:MAG: hypothetical protein A3H91_06795 [Gammaproteobacteria bacterium RIFCSPLOWO2_02_FULL_61_13]|nr:MAG: hypothetical protein A3H91_06795 [Gammaproteobacteria bacterium RIFCSPLOWO2_02_FULL_61_13]